jgi:hypothetical protein
MANAKRGLGRKSHLVAAMAFAGAASMIGQHAQAAATVGGEGMISARGAGLDEDAGDRHRAQAKGENKTGSSAAKRNGKTGNKKAGMSIDTQSAKPAAAQGGKAMAAAGSRDWSHTGNMTGGQKALADAGEFARKAVASGKAMANRPGQPAAMSDRASWRTRSRHLWSTPPVSQRTDYT